MDNEDIRRYNYVKFPYYTCACICQWDKWER